MVVVVGVRVLQEGVVVALVAEVEVEVEEERGQEAVFPPLRWKNSLRLPRRRTYLATATARVAAAAVGGRLRSLSVHLRNTITTATAVVAQEVLAPQRSKNYNRASCASVLKLPYTL